MISYINGIGSFVGSMGKTSKYKLGGYLWILILLGLLTGIVMVSGIYYVYTYLSPIIVSLYPFDFGASLIHSYGGYVVSILSSAVFIMLFKYVILIVFGPILSIISEKIEYQLTGNKNSKGIFSIASELLRASHISLVLLLKEIGYTLLIILLGFVPLIGAASPLLLFFVQAYFIGVATYDYFAERHHTVATTLAIAKKERGLMLGVGTGFALMMMLPVVGLIFGPYFATIAMTEQAVKRGL